MQKVYLSVRFKCGSKSERGVGIVSVHEIERALRSAIGRMDPLKLLLDRVKKDAPALRATLESSSYDTSLKIDNLAHVVRVQFDYELTFSDEAPIKPEAWWENVAHMVHLGPLSRHGILRTIAQDQDFECPEKTFECEVSF
jgi:hypothetical protein